MELFNSLDPVLKTFWIVTISASTIFLIQTPDKDASGTATTNAD